MDEEEWQKVFNVISCMAKDTIVHERDLSASRKETRGMSLRPFEIVHMRTPQSS